MTTKATTIESLKPPSSACFAANDNTMIAHPIKPKRQLVNILTSQPNMRGYSSVPQ